MEEKSVYMDNGVTGGCEPVSVKEWFITFLILIIPIVNLVMLFVWGFGSGANPSKSNYCKAALIWVLIGTVLWFLGLSSLLSILLSA